ncbi:MAG TPA: DUF3800 domain-containing protein [Caldisericia bacterium]|nr:DUF3800 domain-containing protein [Caldisericia bacterium]
MFSVFIDESGDFGFKNKKGTSKFFIIGAAIIKEQFVPEIRRIIKKIRNKLGKNKKKKLQEIKFSNSSHKVKKLVINNLIKHELGYYFIVIDKSKIYENSKLKNKYDYFYNYGFKLLLEKIIKDFNNNERFSFVFDGRRKGVKEYISKLIKNNEIPEIKYEIKEIDSKSEIAICIIDFPVGVIFQKYEHNNFELYELLKPKIKEEKIFPK